MVLALRSLLACLCLILAAPALAEREVHVVAVGRGHRAADVYALPEARVLVDRPGQEVALVLLDGGTLHWRIEVSPGTLVTEILRSGPDARNSRVSLSGIPMTGVEGPDLPLVFAPRGRDFRTLLDRLAAHFGIERLAGFRGVHQMGPDALRILSPDKDTPGLARGYLSGFLAPARDLPPRLRDWAGGGHGTHTAVLGTDGFRLTGPGGTRHFAPPPDMPPILLPVAAVHDPETGMLYGLTYGGTGYIYSVDTQAGAWTVVADLEEYDAGGLLYDPETRVLIATGAFSRPGEIRTFGPDGNRMALFVPTTAFPGLTDLFNYGNEHSPPLIPRAFEDGWLLAEARRTAANAAAFRLYAINLATGEVRLLRFGNG